MLQVSICQVVFRGLKAYEIKNKKLSIIVLPSLGGKIASIKYLENEFEFLFQTNKDYYDMPKPDSLFEAFDASGMDDAFPNIDASEGRFENDDFHFSDHGEIWRSRFEAEVQGSLLVMTFKSDAFQYEYTKKIELLADRLVIHYDILNVGQQSLPFIWTFHGLLKADPKMHLNFPLGTRAVENVLNSDFLGEAGSIHNFPITKDLKGNEYRLDRICDIRAKKYEKYYVSNTIEIGECGVYYPDQGRGLILRYDAQKLPFLGLWVTEGGYRGDYNLAFEPSTGYYDCIFKAQKTGTLKILNPNEVFSHDLEIQVF